MKVAYAYIKGSRYDSYSFEYDGDENTKKVIKEFEELNELVNFMIAFSNFYSVPIQIYQ